jgi:signal transduction histidine kinase
MKRIGITAKLVFGVACILAGLGLAVTWYSVYQLDKLLTGQMRERVEAQARNWIEANYRQIETTDDLPTLERLVSKLQQESWVAYVMLLGPNGKLRVAVGRPEGIRADRRGDKEPPTSGWTAKKDDRGLRYYELATPIPATGTGMSTDLEAMYGEARAASPATEGDSYGSLRVGVDQREFQRRLNEFVRRTVILAGLLVLLAVAASFVFARRMANPITEMGKVATQIASGDLAKRVKRGAGLGDEVGDLVRNFNYMAQRLKENREEMDLLYAGLEQKVRERTLELEEANRRLEERDRLRSEFVSTVSHELRTPLTSIKIHAGILRDTESPTPERLRRGLQIIDESTDRLGRLIADVLDLRRFELGVVIWKTAEVDLGEIVLKSVADVNSQAAGKRIELKIVGAKEQWVSADADWIERVVTNLIGNAVKFCSPGCCVEIGFSQTDTSGPQLAAHGDYALVRVSDNGPGIPQEELHHVFEPFYQAKKRPSDAVGAGLGLAISKEVILGHKGEIWVESSLGCGSTFYFTLPLRATRKVTESQASSAERERRL